MALDRPQGLDGNLLQWYEWIEPLRVNQGGQQ